MEKSEKVTLLAIIVLVGFTATVIFHYVMGFYLNIPYPFNTFLCIPKEAFSDFTSTLPRIRNLTPYSHPDLWMNYFPLAYILLFPFSLIKNRLIAYFIFASGFLTFLIGMNTKIFSVKNLTKVENFRNIFILSFMSYPVLYALDRGNFDMFLLILFAGFVYAFKSEKYVLSAILMGIENAIKPFSILFSILFLFKKRFKEFFLSLLISALLIIGGFLFFKGGFFDQIIIYIINLAKFKKLWVDSNYGIAGDTSSIFSALKFLLCDFGHIISMQVLGKLTVFIGFIVTTITIIFTYREKTYWKKVTLLTLHMLLVPYIIIDYKLIFLLVPIWLFVNSEEKTNFDRVYTVLFGVLLFSKKLFILWLHAGSQSQLVTYGVIINPIIMSLFMGLIIFEQFQKKKNASVIN
jgi:hypothetical protein